MSALTPEVIDLLQKVKAHILEVPNRLIMDDWILKDLKPGDTYIDTYVAKRFEQIIPTCGTVGCIRGWMRELSPDTFIPDILDNLFFPTRWPTKTWIKYKDSSSVEEKAQIAADLIDFAIKTNMDW